jgi:hypothetical protein
VIYFIKDTVNLTIKIGYSKKPAKRLSSLQTSSPYKLLLLGTVPGTEADEVTYHNQFASYRLSGEWFKGEIIEEVLTIIADHKATRVIRRMTVSEPTDNFSGEGNRTSDTDTGLEAVSRIPGLKVKSLSFKLTERPKDDGTNFIDCGVDLRYLLAFETDVPLEELRALRLAMMDGSRNSIAGNFPKLTHTFYDEDNAVIPFGLGKTDGSHIVGGYDAITGLAGETVRVLVSYELRLTILRNAMADVFMGQNYPGAHPLKKAKKLVIALPGWTPQAKPVAAPAPS